MSAGMRILVVDDEPAIRRLLHAALARVGHVVIEAGSGREALNAVQIDRPDVVLLDLGLPDRDGLELIPLIRERAAVVVVSARDDTVQKVAALDLGADDYVTKPFDSEEVLARIRTALRHRRPETSAPAEVRAGPLRINLAERRVRKGEEDVHLTPKEYDFLAELAAHPGRVITHAQLLRNVWGPGHEHDVEYLRVAARALRRKLEADPSAPVLLRNEPGVGYRLVTGD